MQTKSCGACMLQVWAADSVPLPSKMHVSVRLQALKDNVHDLVATDNDLVYVQLIDTRKWNPAKLGPRLEVRPVDAVSRAKRGGAEGEMEA